jgi:hypothetical protein
MFDREGTLHAATNVTLDLAAAHLSFAGTRKSTGNFSCTKAYSGKVSNMTLNQNRYMSKRRLLMRS